MQEVTDDLEADIFLYSGPIFEDPIHEFVDSIEELETTRPNLALILTTYGGLPDAAFRLCRCIKRKYKKFYLFVPGQCKSAGTLIALGADEIVMLSRGELGPLDVQLIKQDDLTGRSSGLDVSDAIRFISEKTMEIFEDNFTTIIAKGGGSITTKTAGEIATSIAVGLMSPITQQLDPFKLGENQRAMNVAFEYGKLLGANPEALQKLTNGYPSHGFVIDFVEAKNEKLFPNIRQPKETEALFFDQFTRAICLMFEENLLREPSSSQLIATYLNPLPPQQSQTTPHHDKDQDGTQPEVAPQSGSTDSHPESNQGPAERSPTPSDIGAVQTETVPESKSDGGSAKQTGDYGIGEPIVIR